MPAVRTDDISELLRKASETLGRELSFEETELARSLVRRMASETGGARKLDSRDLYVAVRDFKRADGIGSYHYLKRLMSVLRHEDRKVVAAMLFAVSRTVNALPIDPLKGLTPGAIGRWVDDVAGNAAYWPQFLDALISPPEHMLLFGAHEMVTGLERTWDLMWTSSTLLMVPGETVDMRLSKLIGRAVDLAAGLGLSPGDAEEVSRLRASVGAGLGASVDEAELTARYRADLGFRGDVEKLFGFLASAGDPATARQANEVLIFLSRTDLYEKRASRPVGQPTANFPATDGADRDQVLDLLKSLGIKLETETDRANAWRIWSASFENRGVSADDLLVDLDKTLYDWSVSLKRLGRENIELREIVIALAAKALRDKKPIPFATHSSATRVEEIVNHPDFAIMKFVLFLRVPQDPTVSLEEILTMPNGLTHDTLAQGEIDTLKRFYESGLDFENLSERDQHVVAMAMTDIEKYFTEFWRGHKFPEMLAHEGRERPRTHLDDTPGNLQVTAGSGMPGVLAPKRLPMADDPTDVSSSYALNMLQVIDWLSGTTPGTIGDVTDTRQTVNMPRAEILYDNYFLRSFRGWVRPAIDLIGIKLKIWYVIAKRGEFSKYREMFSAVMKKERPVILRSDLRRPERYAEGREAEEFSRRIQPTSTTRVDPPITDFIDVFQNEEGGISIVGKSYDPSLPPAKRFGARAGTYPFIRKIGKRAIELLKKGDEDGFNQILAQWGAEIIDYLSLRIDVKGLEKLDPAKKYLFAPNHSSELDYILLFLVLKGYSVGFAGKKFFRMVPYIGKGMSLRPDRFPSLDRSNTESDIETLKRTAEAVGSPENRTSMGIFFEGTRVRAEYGEDGERRDGTLFAKDGLKAGPAHFALDAGLDVVPITTNGFGRIFPAGCDEAITNEKAEIIVGDPIALSKLQGTREEKVEAIQAGLYAAYKRDYKGKNAGEASGRALEALRKIGKTNKSGKFETDEKTVSRLLAKATPVISTFGLDAKEMKKALREGKVNKFRLGLNSYLDRFYEPLFALETGDRGSFEAWLLDHDVSEEFVLNLVTWLPEDEIRGVLARAGFDLNAPGAAQGFGDERQTWEFMRTRRMGWWLVGNVKDRVLSFLRDPLAPSETGTPDVAYHDEKPEVLPSFKDYQDAYRRENAANYAAVESLVEGQMSLQSGSFRNGEWREISQELERAPAGMRVATREYVEARRQVERADYEPVAASVHDLYVEILDSGFFDSSVDENLRLFAFETLLAQRQYRDALAANPADHEAIQTARAHFYRLWGQGTAHHIRNFYDIAKSVGAGSGKLKDIAVRSDMVEMASEVAARGQTLAERIGLVDAELKAMYAKFGFLGYKRFAPMSATAVRYRELAYERELLGKLEALRLEIGADSLDGVLEKLGSDADAIVPLRDEGGLDRLMGNHSGVARAYAEFRGKEAAWEEISARETEALLPARLKLYQTTFETELATNRADFRLQSGRYRDFMDMMRAGGHVTEAQEKKFRQALADYELKFSAYEKHAAAMTHAEARESEPQRKVKELETFFAFLRLQWAVSDIAKETKSPLAGKIRPVSAMFPNQTEVLNSLASDEMEGLRPIFESMTLELVVEMYKEVSFAAHDPRKLERVMAKYGLGAVRRGSSSVHVHGAKAFIGAIGQAVGIDLYEAGKSLLDQEQVERFGTVPRAMAFSSNHQGFFDYPAIAFLAALGVYITIAAEIENFYAFPVFSPLMRHIPTPWGRRGVTKFIDVLPRSTDRGASTAVYDHATKRTTTTQNPLATGKVAAFLSRESIFGGSRAEAATAAAVTRTPTVPTWQHFAFNRDPDLALGNLFKGNFKIPYSIHNGTGPLMNQRATVAFAQPFASWRMKGIVAGREFAPETGMAGLKKLDQRVRRANAATTEVGRYDAYLGTLATGMPAMPMAAGAMPGMGALPRLRA